MSITTRFYTCLISFFNLFVFLYVMTVFREVEMNDLFFALVEIAGKFLDKLEMILSQLAIVLVAFMVYVFRRRFFALLGIERQMVRADLKDILTCFSMRRFVPLELAFWKVTDLPVSGFGSRTVFLQVYMGYNEPLNTRPHDNIAQNFYVTEKLQVNYDADDNTQTLAIIVKTQEVVRCKIMGGALCQTNQAAQGTVARAEP